MLDQNNDLDFSSWAVVKTRPSQEARARENIERQGFQVLLPYRCVTIRKARRLHTRNKPIFPTYLFVDTKGRETRKLYSTFGVSYVLANEAGQPNFVPEDVMRILHEQCQSDGLYIARDELEAGDTVSILSGPFADTIAEVDGLHIDQRVTVFIELMGQKVRTSVPIEHTQKLHATTARARGGDWD